MEVIIQPDSGSASKLGARIVRHLLRKKPDAVLGLATGSTPLELYKELIRMHREEGLDFSRATTFNLDEYIGLGPDHPCSYHYFMWDRLFRHLNVAAERVHIPDGLSADVAATCDEYEKSIETAGGLDLQILGIGSNGHIGFNEPSSSLNSRTRVKCLSPQTIKDNARFFADEASVPRYVITMGVGSILRTRRCVLFAFGEYKAKAVAEMVEGPVTAMLPASALQLHPRATVILDEAAASRLSNSVYYRWAFQNKPGWASEELD